MTAAPQLMFQAIGCVAGTLIKGEDDCYMLLTEQGEAPVRSIRPKLLYWLRNNPEQHSGQWVVHPHTTIKGELKSVHLVGLNAQWQLPCAFRVSGYVVYQRDGLIAIRIQPNEQDGNGQTRFKPFNITIEGYLPEQSFGQFWQLEVDFEAGKLVMQDALKLAEAEPKPEADRKRTPKQTAKRRSKPEPPIKKRTTNADQPEPAAECA